MGVMDSSVLAVSIGNSDDKLTQREWADYFADVRGLIRHRAAHVHGEFASLPSSPYQNACFLFEGEASEGLLRELADLAADYRQTSIAVTIGNTIFVQATGLADADEAAAAL